MKKCSKCGETKTLEEFQKRAVNKDGYTGICKTCKRAYDNAHYKANPDRKQYIRDNSAKRTEENRSWVYEYLLEHPCIDCGESDPIVLEFDHAGDKEINVSTATRWWKLDRLKSEVAKCDVRCANCHRRKTARDFGFWRVVPR